MDLLFKGLVKSTISSLHLVRLGLLEEGDQLLHLVWVDFGFFLVLGGHLCGKVVLENSGVEVDTDGEEGCLGDINWCHISILISASMDEHFHEKGLDHPYLEDAEAEEVGD